MFVRVFDKEKNRYFKSMVYAKFGFGYISQYVVLNPHTHCFELVDYMDKQIEPAKPLVELIQTNHEEFIVCNSANIPEYGNNCKSNGNILADMNPIMGYSEVLENHAFLADLLGNRSAPFDAYHIPEKTPGDAAEWNYILTQADAYIEKPDNSYEGSIIRALNLKWRKIDYRSNRWIPIY